MLLMSISYPTPLDATDFHIISLNDNKENNKEFSRWSRQFLNSYLYQRLIFHPKKKDKILNDNFSKQTVYSLRSLAQYNLSFNLSLSTVYQTKKITNPINPTYPPNLSTVLCIMSFIEFHFVLHESSISRNGHF